MYKGFESSTASWYLKWVKRCTKVDLNVISSLAGNVRLRKDHRPQSINYADNENEMVCDSLFMLRLW